MTHASEKLKLIISDIMELDEPIDDTTDLVNDIGMASIDFVELTVAIEKAFGVSVPNEVFSRTVTVHSLSTLISQLAAQKEPA